MGKKKANIFIYVILGILTVAVLYPLYFIVLTPFKGKFYISKQPFELPKGELFAGLTNYTNGLEQTGLIEAKRMVLFHNDRFRGTDHLFYIDDSLLCDKSKR